MGQDIDLETIKTMFETIKKSEGEPRPVQLSGGEPTVRKDLPQIVELGVDLGFSHIEVNTNGVLIAKKEDLVKSLKDAGLSCVYLQFDGLTSDVYEKLRGVDLLDLKFKAIENCRKHGLPVILVPTIVEGVNDHQLGDIVRFAMRNLDVVRGISVQPVSHFGRFRKGNHLSLAGVVKRISDQTGFMSMYDFYPIPCPSLHCSSATMLIDGGNEVFPVTKMIDMETYLNGVYDQVEGATFVDMVVDAEKGVDMAEAIVCSCGIQISGAIQRVLENSLFITVMGFMDAYTLDLSRLSKCCIHVVTPDRRLIPFCAYNLTNTHGEYLYRGRSEYRQKSNQSSSSGQPLSDIQLKKSTTRFYEGSFLNKILGNVLRPGGVKLTEQLAISADINEKSRVLDIASGNGASAVFLAKRFKCEVVGIDLAKSMIRKAADLAKTDLIADRVVFEIGDAEKLPFKNGAFDAIISECALCLFPSKKQALSEMHRVLKDRGKIAMSDVTLQQTTKNLRNKLLFFSCIAGAESSSALKSLLKNVGFVEVAAIDASQAIFDLYKKLKRQSHALKPLLKMVGRSNQSINPKNMMEFSRTAEQLILEKKLGYSILTGRKTSQAPGEGRDQSPIKALTATKEKRKTP